MPNKYNRKTNQNYPAKYKTKKSAEQRFHERVRVGSDDECWLWTGTTDNDGYGVLWVGGRNVRAHRYSYELEYGPIPSGLLCLHHCDCPSCVNPRHLFVGTAQDNSTDCVSKDRIAYGRRNGMSKITDKQVAEIRSIAGMKLKDIAVKYGISKSHVGNLRTNPTYRRRAGRPI